MSHAYFRPPAGVLTPARTTAIIARVKGTRVRVSGEGDSASESSRQATIASLRARMAQMTGDQHFGVAAAASPVIVASDPAQAIDSQADRDVDSLGLGDDLAAAVPLSRGDVTEVSPCEALVATLIAQATAGGNWVGVVGWPDLSFATVADAGGDIDLVVSVPRAPDLLSAATILAEGLDLVVCRGAGTLTPTRARSVRAKLRRGTAALVAVETSFLSPFARVRARVGSLGGIGRGTGRVTELGVDLQTATRGAPPITRRLRLGGLGVAGQEAAGAAFDAGRSQPPQPASQRRLRAV